MALNTCVTQLASEEHWLAECTIWKHWSASMLRLCSMRSDGALMCLRCLWRIKWNIRSGYHRSQ